MTSVTNPPRPPPVARTGRVDEVEGDIVRPDGDRLSKRSGRGDDGRNSSGGISSSIDAEKPAQMPVRSPGRASDDLNAIGRVGGTEKEMSGAEDNNEQDSCQVAGVESKTRGGDKTMETGSGKEHECYELGLQSDELEDGDDDGYLAVPNQMPPQLMQKLSKFPLFRNAPPAFHKAIAGRLKLMTHHAQEYIVKFGEPAKSMYWILRGSVAVTSPDGEAVHAELVAGQFFGEIGILFNRPRTATVIAQTKVLLGVLTAENFNAVLPDFPAVERTIRDEAQERLSMQDKRKKNGLSNIINTKAVAPVIDADDLDTAASAVAIAASTLPGPSVPPMMRRSPSPPEFTGDVLSSFGNESYDCFLPQVHDNVDQSIPTRDFLRGLPMFTLLPSNIIHELVLGVEPRRYDPFEYIVRKGELGRDIYFIVNGEVEVLAPKRFSLDDSNGAKEKKVDIVLGRLGQGQYFGEMAFLQSLSNDGDRIERSADIRTVSTVDVVVVTGDQLEGLYARYPQICDEMRETARKRTDKNRDQETEEIELQASPFGKWRGFQSSVTSRKTQPILATTNNDTPIGPADSTTHTGAHIASSTTAASSAPSLNAYRLKPSSSSTLVDDTWPPFSKKRVHSQISPSDLPLNIGLPPMNPTVPSVNQFPSHQRPHPFHYMDHAKRLRLAPIAGRRRSSLLSTGVLPDRVLLKVFSTLKLHELMKLRLICRRWRQLLYVAPGLFEKLDLTQYNTSINDKALIQITDFVGSRPKEIDISNCFHVTDVGLSYMVNEIGMSGSIRVIKMSSVWEASAMAIMDIAVQSIGHHIEELDLSNCRKVRDDVIERIVGWKTQPNSNAVWNEQSYVNDIDSPESSVGCPKLKVLSLGYCKHLTDRSMYHIAMHANDRIEALDITRCTTITDAGFAYWAYQPFSMLKKLKLNDCTFLSDKSIAAIASSAQNLEVLDLSFCCALTDVSIDVLSLGCPNLRYLDASFCGSAVSDSTLLTLSIHLRHLQSLVIKGCVRVTRAGVDALLTNSTSLTYLDISQCRNAHFYSDSSPGIPFQPRPGSRSAFISTANAKVVEIVV